MVSKFRSRYAFKLLVSTALPGKILSWYYNERHHHKCPMNGVGGTVKNVIFRKVKSSQLVVYSPLAFCEAEAIFVPLIYSVYLSKNKNTFEPEEKNKARKIGQTLKYISWKENVFKMVILKSIFSKLPMMSVLFTWSGMRARMKSSVAMLKPVKAMMNVRNARSYNEGERWFCCPAPHQWCNVDCFLWEVVAI